MSNIWGRDINNTDEIVMNRRIKFAMLKQEWSIGKKLQALQGLEILIRTSLSSDNASSTVDTQSYLSCLLKLGEWKIAILEPGLSVDSGTRAEVLNIFSKSTIVDPNSYRAWHQWGLSNYRAVEESKISGVSSLFTTPSKKYPSNHSLSKLNQANVITSNESLTLSYVVNAIKGLMRALTLGTRRWSSSVAQDMLCILSLWFKYGKQTEVSIALEAGLSVVHLDNWLGVLPQLIARIDHQNDNVRGLLHHLLIRLGVKHSQALVYPLSVALKSPNDSRKEAAESLMNSLRQNNPKLIDQALLVSQELVRVAILWEENWHWSLEEASPIQEELWRCTHQEGFFHIEEIRAPG
jgi:FKBP12-rapamycin complex-associated protein